MLSILLEAKYDIVGSKIRIKEFFGHCIGTWYAMSRSLVKLMEIGTSRGLC